MVQEIIAPPKVSQIKELMQAEMKKNDAQS
jgi:hypothetical protein